LTLFDLTEKPGSWFEMEGGGRVQLKTISTDEWREIQKATVKKGPPEYPKLDDKYQRFQADIVDGDLQMEMIWDKTILAWENLMDKGGEPIPCTKEFKVKLMLMKSPAFRDFYLEKMKAIDQAEAEQELVTEKNLSSG